MARAVLLAFVILVTLCNVGFDWLVTPVGVRVASKLEAADQRGNPTDAPFYHPLRAPVRRIDRYVPLWVVARWLFALRYVLTGLPLFLLLSLAWLRRLRDSHLALAVWLGAFFLIGKVAMWETLWLMVDVCVCPPSGPPLS